jgi:hypothetical protein
MSPPLGMHLLTVTARRQVSVVLRLSAYRLLHLLD